MTNQVGYIKVQKDLRKKIIKGQYTIGSLLPSENKLSERYGLSRMTIRHALKNLENEGLISRRQGKGSIVEYQQKSIELLSIKGFTEVMKGEEVDISTIFIQMPELKNWKKDFYWDLGTKELKVGCIHFSRVRVINEKAIMYEDTCISNQYLSDFCSTLFINNSLFETLLIKYDIEITGVTQKFRAISASEKISKRLNIKKGNPVLEITRKLSTSKPNLFVYSFLYCNTDDFTIET
jgi:GntR family transcriptional regulator/GntR family frlABCD operon transcriptional regulator